MRTRHWTAVAVAMALATVPASAQMTHEHGGEEGPPEDTQAMMCHQMMGGEMGDMGMGMDGHDMMNGQSMMGDPGMMSGGMGVGMIMRSMTGMPGMGMTLGSEPDASVILGAAEELGLDELQIERLEAIRERSLEIHGAHMEASVGAREEASVILGADVLDLDEYEQALWEAAQHMVTAHLGLVRLSFEARDLLSPEQVERLDAVLRGRGGMRCSMMQDESGSSEGHAEYHR